MSRLLAAAKAMHGMNGTTELAEALGESVQAVGNWAQRGVSKAGALKAEQLLGISARWILTATGPQSTTPEFLEGLASADVLVRRLRALLMQVPAAARDEIGRQLQALALAPDSAMLAESLRKSLSARRPDS